MKNMHALAKAYQGTVQFYFVDVKKDEDNIAFSLGVDALDPAFLPCVMLINGENMYIAPKRVTEAYYLLGNYIETGYKTQALTVWPLQRRLGPFSYVFKCAFRKAT